MSATDIGRWYCPHEANGKYCAEHNSWLCSQGQGKCQSEAFCPLAGPYPDEGGQPPMTKET